MNSAMVITGLETYVVHAIRCNWVFVRIQTSDGISGVGEATVEMKELAVAQAVKELESYLVGKDPFAIEHHVHIMNRDSYWRNGVILRSALSAVEMALFDIKAKALNVPVYELLGGKCRDRVPCYANGWFSGAKTPAQFAEKARAAAEMGFKALKFDPFGSSYLRLSPLERDTAYEIVEAVRESVGEGVDLLIEAHGRLDVPNAIEMARRFEPLRPAWYEEPVGPDNLSAVAEVRKRSQIAIAFGERLFDPQRFLEALNLEALDIAQPDVCHVGGLIETKRIASLAALHARCLAPHNPNGPVCNAATLQIAASTPNFSYLETMVTDVPWRKDVAPETLTMIDGEMLIPDRPGLGIDLQLEAMLQHPFIARGLRHYSGALTDIRPDNAEPWFTRGVGDYVPA